MKKTFFSVNDLFQVIYKIILIVVVGNISSLFACENHPPREISGQPMKKGAYGILQDALSSIIMISTTTLEPEMLQILNKKAEEGLSIEITMDRGESIKRSLHPNIVLRKLTTEAQQILIIDESYVWMGSLRDPHVFSSKSSSIGYYSPSFAEALLAQR